VFAPLLCLGLLPLSSFLCLRGGRLLPAPLFLFGGHTPLFLLERNALSFRFGGYAPLLFLHGHAPLFLLPAALLDLLQALAVRLLRLALFPLLLLDPPALRRGDLLDPSPLSVLGRFAVAVLLLQLSPHRRRGFFLLAPLDVVHRLALRRLRVLQHAVAGTAVRQDLLIRLDLGLP
jgi:hypothetical protein